MGVLFRKAAFEVNFDPPNPPISTLVVATACTKTGCQSCEHCFVRGFITPANVELWGAGCHASVFEVGGLRPLTCLAVAKRCRSPDAQLSAKAFNDTAGGPTNKRFMETLQGIFTSNRSLVFSCLPLANPNCTPALAVYATAHDCRAGTRPWKKFQHCLKEAPANPGTFQTKALPPSGRRWLCCTDQRWKEFLPPLTK